MASQKKNIEEDDNIEILKPCFKIGPDVKLREVPTTGEEFLLKVITERKHYAVITQCNKDYSGYAKNQNSFIEEAPPIQVADKLKPTIEWQNIQVADFSEQRLKIARLREKPDIVYTKLKKQPLTRNQWKRVFDGSEPTLSIVLGLKSALVDGGLDKLTEMLDEVQPGDTIGYRLGQWAYSLLVCVRHPFLSETICILRGLARKCAEIRSRINPDDENAPQAAAPLNVFICLIGRYFEQFDLADR